MLADVPYSSGSTASFLSGYFPTRSCDRCHLRLLACNSHCAIALLPAQQLLGINSSPIQNGEYRESVNRRGLEKSLLCSQSIYRLMFSAS